LWLLSAKAKVFMDTLHGDISPRSSTSSLMSMQRAGNHEPDLMDQGLKTMNPLAVLYSTIQPASIQICLGPIRSDLAISKVLGIFIIGFSSYKGVSS
jgi:hypothetical protein